MKSLLFIAVICTMPLVWTMIWVVITQGMQLAYLTFNDLPRRGLSPVWLTVTWSETKASLFAQWWQLRWFTANRILPLNSEQPLVLCVHGFTQNATNFEALRARLTEMGRSSEGINLGLPPRSMERYSNALIARVEARINTDGSPFDVICHSMGGLVLRLTLQKRPEFAPHFRRVVTLASPHFGTGIAALFPLMPETQFMHPQSESLKQLPQLSDFFEPSQLFSLGSTDDAIVYPETTTHIPTATHYTVEGLGHAGVLMHPDAVDPVISFLCNPEDVHAPLS